MTFLGPLGFAQPWFLLGFLVLPALWYLLRFVPPQPEKVWFPPLRLLQGLDPKDQSPEKTPWWLLLLRVLLVGLLICAFARPVWNPDRASIQSKGKLLIVVDNSWAAASQWERRREAIDDLVSQAEQNGSLVVLATTSQQADVPVAPRAFRFEKASVVREQAASLEPLPYRPQRMKLLPLLQTHIKNSDSLHVVWLSDGLDYQDGAAFAQGLHKIAGSNGRFSVYHDNKYSPLGVLGSSGPSGLEALVVRAGGENNRGQVYAWSSKGERLAEAEYKFQGSELETRVKFSLPFEMRNQVRRLSLSGNNSAGSVYLLDSRSLRYRIGLLSGEANDRSQPLLSPVYYIEKAIKPYAEVIAPTEKNISVALEDVLRVNPSILLLADIGKLVEDDRRRLQEWVQGGGFLVRFAGPRLEKHSDQLLPVGLRRGGRTLGGALSWGRPQKLAAFEKDSPFYGLTVNKEVTVGRQVLADPALLAAGGEVWSRLEDGTPLVTARKDKDGWLVLFHVTANSEWSNLPLSGLFVEMLRRLTEMAGLSDGGKIEKLSSASQGDVSRLAQPVKVLNGYGELIDPKASHKPINIDIVSKKAPGPGAPPGYYEIDGSAIAYNVMRKNTALRALSGFPSGVNVNVYQKAQSLVLFPWVLLAAALLLMADTFAWLFMNRQTMGKYATSALVLFALGSITTGLFSEAAFADEERRKMEFALKAANDTRFAYVLTGDENTDRVSRQGLTGLSRVVALRTAVEPAEPMAIDLERDELSFFPILYWPIHVGAKDLSDSVLAKVDAYMRRGGLILFDTRDFQSASSSFGSGASPAMKTLQRLVGKLNIPRLAPVSEGHVVTKSFYLLRNFPGRWDGGKLWVEAQSRPSTGDQRRARHADGVTSIMITSNDFASAWALDNNSRPVLPIVPGGDYQREMAFRAGINIVMYALTGNYKADQVHVPALLERLGQ